jgi:hypothetical protein
MTLKLKELQVERPGLHDPEDKETTSRETWTA